MCIRDRYKQKKWDLFCLDNMTEDEVAVLMFTDNAGAFLGNLYDEPEKISEILETLREEELARQESSKMCIRDSLANIINEAALRAVRLGRNAVEQPDLEESVETVIAGAQRKNAVLSPKEKEIVAYHEIGHALVAAKQSNSAPVTKITIVPRTSGALGYTRCV